MIEKDDFYSLRSLENIFVGSTDKEIIYNSELIERSKGYRDITGNPIPRKFLPDDTEEILVKGLHNRGIKPTRIWLLPFDKNEYNEGLVTIVAISLAKNKFNPNTERCSQVHYAVRDILEDVRCGRPITYVTWDELVDTCLPNPVRPEYQPNWEI